MGDISSASGYHRDIEPTTIRPHDFFCCRTAVDPYETNAVIVVRLACSDRTGTTGFPSAGRDAAGVCLVLQMAARFRLAEMLEERGISQRKLADKSGVSLVTINRIATGKTTRVDLATLDALARVLVCEPGDLIERKGRK